MKILFIVDFLSFSHFGREPLGVLYLMSALKSRGFEAELADYSEFKNGFKIMRQIKPGLVGYSIKTGYHRKFISLNRELKKEFKFVSLFGGPHATFYPEVINESGVDVICRGEAENSIINLVANLDKGNYEKTEGFWVKRDGSIYQNPLAELAGDLDSLAFPERKALERFSLFKNFRMRNFLSSRGCPFDCSYCFNPALRKMYHGKGAYIRRRSVGNLITEIKEELRDSRLNFINFEDDIFAQDKNWLSEFSGAYASDIKLPFHCHVRISVIDGEKASLLKKAGCFSVSLGVETAKEALRENTLCRKMSDNLILDTCSMLKSYKINVALQNMLGLPGTGLDSDLETLKLNIKCKADYSITSMFTPYPGTKIAEMYHFSDWEKVKDYYDSSVYPIENKKERENLQKIFALLVKAPFSLTWAPWIIKLPLKQLYNFIGLTWKYFWGRKKIFPTGFR